MEEYNDLSNKSDSFILNIVKQKENYSSDFYKAALKIFEERRLSIENAELIFKQRKDEINTLKDMIINGKSKEEIRMALNKSYIHPSEINSLISSTYKGLEIELVDDHKSRSGYYIYSIFWFIGFSIFLVIFLERFFGDSVLLFNFLLLIPLIYYRFKSLPKLIKLRSVNHMNGYYKS